LHRRWDTANERFKEDITSWRALWDIFLEMLENCKCRRIYVVVDALDGCQGGGMAEFLKPRCSDRTRSRVEVQVADNKPTLGECGAETAR
jgi:hypothetical protein